MDTYGSVLALGHHPQIKKRGDVGLELHAPYFTKVKSPSREEVDIDLSLLSSFLKQSSTSRRRWEVTPGDSIVCGGSC